MGHPETGVGLSDGGTRVVQLVQHHLKMRRINTRHRDVATGHGSGNTPGGAHDAVADHAVLGRVQPRDSGDGHRRRSRAFDLRAHLVQHGAQIDHIGFARRVVNCGDTLGHHGGHQDVFGGSDRREFQLNLRAAQRICGGDHAPVLDVALCAELPQARLVHVQRTRSDRVTTGQRNLGALAATDQRSQHADRGAELSHGGEVGVVFRLVGRGDSGDVAVELDGGAQAAQHLRHQRYVQDVGAIGDCAGALGQQGRGHQLEHAVLGAAHCDFAR